MSVRGKIISLYNDLRIQPLATHSPSLLYNGYRVFLGGRSSCAWNWPPTPSYAEVEERV